MQLDRHLTTQFWIANSYENFFKHVLICITHFGYNTIQFVSIMELAYYASQIFRCVTPEDLKRLIDITHGLSGATETSSGQTTYFEDFGAKCAKFYNTIIDYCI